MVAASLPPTGKLLPFSCSTHLANDVTERLRQAKLSSRALEFCLFLHRQTFGNAGWHRKHGRPEWRCRFDLSTWAKALGWDKSNLRRLRQGLEQCHIVCFEPDPADSGQGWLGWNLQFQAWQPYDGRRTRAPGQQARSQQGGVVKLAGSGGQLVPGQGDDSGSAFAQAALQAAQQQACVVISPPRTGENAPDQQGGVVRSAGDQEPSAVHQANVVRFPQLMAGVRGAKQLCQIAEKGVQMTTPASSEMAPTVVSAATVRKGLRKKTATPNVVAERQSPSLAGEEQVQQREDKEDGIAAGALAGGQATHVAPSAHPAPPPAFSWPPRAAHEKTDLDYFQRVLREREGQRVALLTRLAHERIGVPQEPASYARIGALAKKCGAALLVKHILLAAAQHLDGDPLDYLTKLASHSHSKETSDAFHSSFRTTTSSRPTERPSGNRPYTGEEAKQLVWHVL